MCDTRNSRCLVVQGDRRIRVDGCMKNIISFIDTITMGKTLACCCGHGHYPMSIIVQMDNGIFDIMSGTRIPRIRNFYRTDDEGFYYIPEVSKPISPGDIL